MTTPADPSRQSPPTVREIAALTARLRDISGRGRAVNEAQRAAFLADKDALLARIPHPADDTVPAAVAGGGRGGFVPRLDADPAAARYESMSAVQAQRRIAQVGFTAADAQLMVEQYVTEQSTRHGEPAGGWQLDPYDLAEIARRYEWVDHYQGESVADGQARALRYASEWQQRSETVDRERDPAGAARADAEAELWLARGSGMTVEQARAVQAVHAALARRDAAIEGGDQDAAEDFAGQARGAVEAAVATGTPGGPLLRHLAHPEQPSSTDIAGAAIPSEAAGDHTDSALPVIEDGFSVDDADLGWELPEPHFTEYTDRGMPVEVARTGTEGPVMAQWTREQALRRQVEVEVADRAEHGPDQFEVPITHREAAQQLTELGFDEASAQAMVVEYLHETSHAVGVPVYQWGLDGHDVDAIAERYDWMGDLGEQGLTNLDQARQVAAGYAAGYADKLAALGPDHDPDYAAAVTGLARTWAERSRVPEPFTRPAIDDDSDVDGDPWSAERADEVAFDAVCERHPLPGDGPGYWVTDGDGVRWDEGVVVDDDTDPETTLAPSEIWDEPSADRCRAGAEWDAVRGDDPRSYSTMMGDAARALGSVAPAGQDDAVRREQLTRWHAEDQTAENTVDAEQVDGAPVDLGRG